MAADQDTVFFYKVTAVNIDGWENLAGRVVSSRTLENDPPVIFVPEAIDTIVTLGERLQVNLFAKDNNNDILFYGVSSKTQF